MPHTYTSLLVHCVFSAKERRALIPEEIQPRLWSYMGEISRTNNIKALAIGGMPDHVHLLLSLRATMPIAKAVQLIKAGSSKWMHEQVGRKLFSWQEAYGGFSIGISQIQSTTNYINNQKAHHRKRNFDEEWKMILKRHGIVPE